MAPWSIRRVTDLHPDAKSRGHRNLLIVSPYLQLKGRLNLWIVWCGYGVRQGGGGRKWSWVGDGHKKMPGVLTSPL